MGNSNSCKSVKLEEKAEPPCILIPEVESSKEHEKVVKDVVTDQDGFVMSFNHAQLHQPSRKAFSADIKTTTTKKQPFHKLPSFPVAATLLSLYGYKDQAFELLQQLSVTTRLYYANHKKFLVNFLLRRPPPRTLPYFGSFRGINDDNHCEFNWPHADNLRIDAITQDSLQSQRVKLHRVVLKHNSHQLLSVQAVLSDQVRSRFKFHIQQERSTGTLTNLSLMNEKAERKVVTVTVESPPLESEIGRVGLKLLQISGRISNGYAGIELFDRNGVSMFKAEWCFGRWEFQDIPCHKTVVGFHGCASNIVDKENPVKRLGLVVLRQ